jgi:hypothetical protein
MKMKISTFSINHTRKLTLPLSVLIALAISACTGTPKVSVMLMPNSDQRLESGKTLPISATLTNDSERKGVTWTLTGAGALVAETTTSVMYQAPTNITTQESVTVTATPLARGGKPTSLTIILVPQKSSDTEHKDHPDQKGERAEPPIPVL